MGRIHKPSIMITVEKLNKSYGTLQVLKDISLTIEKGEIVSVVGASGAGKTTLLQLLGTLDRPDGGRILYDCSDGEGKPVTQVDVTRLDEKGMARFRNRHIGFVSAVEVSQCRGTGSTQAGTTVGRRATAVCSCKGFD